MKFSSLKLPRLTVSWRGEKSLKTCVTSFTPSRFPNMRHKSKNPSKLLSRIWESLKKTI